MDPQVQNNQPPQPDQQGAAVKIQALVEKFKALPPKHQAVVVGGVLLLLILLFSGGDDRRAVQRQAPKQVQQAAPAQELKQAPQQAIGANGAEEEMEGQGFEIAAPDEAGLMSQFVEQQRVTLSQMRAEMENKLSEREGDLKEIESAITRQSQQMQQMLDTFNAQMRTMEAAGAQEREEMARMIQEAQQKTAEEVEVEDAVGQPQRFSQRDQRIQQHPLAGGGGVRANPNQALLKINGRTAPRAQGGARKSLQPPVEPNPFVPPLGFISGMMINGVDALVGAAAPALVRLSGTYKTAMNSSVTLDGCIAFVEFEADVSTERATGKPSRMTCVYPDRGAVVYSLSGYVVNPEDGIAGIPGVFYEGDASKMAAVMTTEFLTGALDIMLKSQLTQESGAEGGGENVENVTGNEIKAQFAQGASNALSMLREYLAERADRVVPFIRLDATREISIVLMDGFELRRPRSASPWTMLVDATSLDAYQDSMDSYNAGLEEATQKENEEKSRR